MENGSTEILRWDLPSRFRWLGVIEAAIQEIGQELDRHVEVARAEVINVVTNFFCEKLTAVPTIKAYIDHYQKE